MSAVDSHLGLANGKKLQGTKGGTLCNFELVGKMCGTDQSSRLTPSPLVISLHIHVRINLITSKIRSLTTRQYLLLIGETLSANQSKCFISVISIDHIVSQVFPDPHYKGAFQCDLLLNILRIHLV